VFTITSLTKLDERTASDLDSLTAVGETFDGVVCLETESELNAYPDMKSLFFAYQEDRLIGALTLFAPLKLEAEVNALTLPAARNQGVFRALLDEAERELKRFGYPQELLVVESRLKAGKAVAEKLGGRHEYTEYAMRFKGPCPSSPIKELEISRVGIERLSELVDLRAGEFGDTREEAENFEKVIFASKDRQVYAASLEGKLVVACSLAFQGACVSINGFVTDKPLRGKGYGQAFMTSIIQLLEPQGFEMILDVNSQNSNAYHIYKKLGFVEKKAVDYYRRPVLS